MYVVRALIIIGYLVDELCCKHPLSWSGMFVESVLLIGVSLWFVVATPEGSVN